MIEPRDYRLEAGFFLAELLSVLRVAPDIRIFKFEHDFFQLFAFLVVVKDTPGAIQPGISGHQFAGKYDLFPRYLLVFEKTRILPDPER